MIPTRIFFYISHFFINASLIFNWSQRSLDDRSNHMEASLRLSPLHTVRIWKWRNVSTVFPPHHAWAIWEQRFLSENESNIFRPQYVRGIKYAKIIGHFGFVFEKDSGWKTIVIIARSSFSQNSVFKMVSVYSKTQEKRFQIPRVWRTLWKSSVLVAVSCWQ